MKLGPHSFLFLLPFVRVSRGRKVYRLSLGTYAHPSLLMNAMNLISNKITF